MKEQDEKVKAMVISRTNNVNGCIHKTINHSAKEYVNGMTHTNGIEGVWVVLKRGYNGTFHNISTKHLNRYINEFVFRLNEGNCQIDTKDRMVSLFKGIGNNSISYKELTG